MDYESLSKIFGYSWKIFAFLAAFTGLLTYHFGEKLKEKKSQENSENGVIKQPNTKNKTDAQKVLENMDDEVFRDVNFKDLLNDSDNFFVEIGGNTNHYTRKDLNNKKGIELTAPFVKLPITIRIENNQLLVSLETRSYDGKIIADIIDNNWRINPNNYFKKNHDHNAFEVVDDFGVTVIQIVYANENTIIINGVFLDNGVMTILNKEGLHYVGKINSIEEYINNGKTLSPIFQYGKNKYGKRLKPD